MHKQTRKRRLTGFKLKEEGPRPRNVEDLKLRRTEQPRSPKKQRQVVLLMVEPIVNKGTLPWQKRSQENASKCWPFCPSFSWWQMWCDQPCGLSPPYLLHPQALSQNKSSLLDAVFCEIFLSQKWEQLMHALKKSCLCCLKPLHLKRSVTSEVIKFSTLPLFAYPLKQLSLFLWLQINWCSSYSTLLTSGSQRLI